MTWEFSDGTIVRLGGDVEGASLFAQELREALANPDTQVEVAPPPGGTMLLDRNDLALMNAWVRSQWRKPYRSSLHLKLRSAPTNVPPLPKIRPDEVYVDGRLY